MGYKLAISPCPNDTFVFDALINGRIDCGEFSFDVEYKDIEQLNEGVLRGEPDISKISTAVYPKIAEQYEMLDCGSALGNGNGQLLVRRKGFDAPLRRIASPGANTTAEMLLRRYFPKTEEIVQMLFSDIAAAVERGEVDGGVLIHEGRFVYEQRQLELVADLGALWQNETGLPLPLGAIVIRRSLPEAEKEAFNALLRRSYDFAQNNPTASRAFVKEHAQELDDDVIDKHIALFVNDFTRSIGEMGRKAVERLTGLNI